MIYLIILFGVLAVACFGISFGMYLRDKRKAPEQYRQMINKS